MMTALTTLQCTPVSANAIVMQVGVGEDAGAPVIEVVRLFRVDTGDEIAELRIDGLPVARMTDPAYTESEIALFDDAPLSAETARAIIDAAYAALWATLEAWEAAQEKT